MVSLTRRRDDAAGRRTSSRSPGPPGRTATPVNAALVLAHVNDDAEIMNLG